MKLGIIKRVFAFSCAAVLVFSMSGCVSNSSTDNAKSLGSSGDDYNITEFEEEEVIVDQSIKISFSEKGTVRYEGTGTNLIDFWEYGAPQSDTVYFEGAGGDFLEDYYKRDCIEFAFEYKNMIYFLKRTYEKTNYVYTLYRMDLKGDNITKVSSITLKNNLAAEVYSYCEYEITDVYVQNNNVILSIYDEEYDEVVSDYDYDENSEDDYEINSARRMAYVYKIDLRSGISNELMKTQNFSLSKVRCDSNFTYIYSEGSSQEDFKVYKIDNKTNDSKVIQYNISDNNASYYKIADVYSYADVIDVNSDVLICQDDHTVILVSVNEKPKSIFSTDEFDSNISIINTWVIDNNLIIQLKNEDTEKIIYYTYDFNTGKLAESSTKDDINKAIFKLGDKYLCFVPDSTIYSGDYQEKCEYYYWSSINDVLANKHNFSKIKNQRMLYYFD